MPTPHMIRGYPLSVQKLQVYADKLNLDVAQAANHVAKRLGLYPRVRLMMAEGKRHPIPCLVVASNFRSDNMPMISREDLESLKKFLRRTEDPKWFHKG